MLTSKIKSLTRVLKLAPQDTVLYVVHRQQAQFMKGWQMERHVFSVNRIFKSGRQGAWLRMKLAKAFDSTSHTLLQFFVDFLGVLDACISAHMQFLKGAVRYLIGNQLAAP